MVLLGDHIDANPIWEWDGTAWVHRDATGPMPSGDYSLAYDTRRGTTVAYGGFRWDFPNTWEWDGFSWTPREDASLQGRLYPVIIYDSRRGVTVMFGGWGVEMINTAKPHPQSDTWEWDGVRWSQRQGSGPLFWRPFLGAFDRPNGVMVLHDAEAWGETWIWDGTQWSLRSREGPSGMFSPTMTFDDARRVGVLFGGSWSGQPETWEWDGATWRGGSTALAPPPSEGHAITYDANRGLTILFGGSYDGAVLGDTWAWNGAAWRVESCSGPCPRSHAGLAYDRGRGRVVLFGGIDASWSALKDTWEYDGRSWSLLSSDGPELESQPALVYDEQRALTVLVQVGARDQIWEWNGNVWRQRFAPGFSEEYENALVDCFSSGFGFDVLHDMDVTGVMEDRICRRNTS